MLDRRLQQIAVAPPAIDRRGVGADADQARFELRQRQRIVEERRVDDRAQDGELLFARRDHRASSAGSRRPACAGERIQAARGDDDFGEERRDRGADHSLRRHEREVRGHVRDRARAPRSAGRRAGHPSRSPDASARSSGRTAAARATGSRTSARCRDRARRRPAARSPTSRARTTSASTTPAMASAPPMRRTSRVSVAWTSIGNVTAITAAGSSRIASTSRNTAL